MEWNVEANFEDGKNANGWVLDILGIPHELRDLAAFSSGTLDLKTVSDFVQMKGIYD